MYFQYHLPIADVVFTRMRHIRASNAPVLVAGAVSEQFTTIASTTIPGNERGYLVGYGIQVEDPTYDYGGSLLFRVVVQASPIDDGAPFPEQRGTLIQPAPAHYAVDAGNKVEIQARRAIAYAFAQRVAGVALIYSWPKVIGEVYPGTYRQNVPDGAVQRGTR